MAPRRGKAVVKISPVTIHGKLRYRVDCGLINGKRKQPSFAVREDAEKFLRVAKAEKAESGRKGLSGYLSISSLERSDIIRAKELKSIQGISASWEELVTFYASHSARHFTQKSTGDAVTAFLKAKKEQTKPRKLSAAYLAELEYMLRAFALEFPKNSLSDFNEEIIREYLEDFSNGFTFNNNRNALYMLFSMGVEHRWTPINPCQKIEKAGLDEAPPEIYSNSEVQSLLTTAAHEKEFQSLLPAYAIGFFGFLRVAEIRRLDRSEIKLRDNHPLIVVSASKSKTRSLRNVAISPNLLKILTSIELPNGLIAPQDFDWKREKLHEAAGVKMKRNGIRHTGASNHCVRPFQLP